MDGIPLRRSHALLGVALLNLLGSFHGYSGGLFKTPRGYAAIADEPVSALNVFALDGYTLGEENQRVIDNVENCMASHGFRYLSPTKITSDVQGVTVRDYWNHAQSYGYFSPPITTGTSQYDGNFSYVARLSFPAQRRYWQDLTGKPTQPAIDEIILSSTLPLRGPGCINWAEHVVLGKLPWFNPKLGPELRALDENQYSLPGLAGAIGGWRKCMLHFGYLAQQYDDVETLFQGKGQRWPLPRSFFMEQRRAAIADAWCYISRLHPIQRRVEVAILRNIILAYPQYEAEFKRASG